MSTAVVSSTSPSPSNNFRTANLGFPRMGLHRELKFAMEDFWKGRIPESDLLAVAAGLRARHWKLQVAAGVDVIPSNDFSFYDQVLDALVAVGATPERFGKGEISLEKYFAMARNSDKQGPMEMTKWFDTNYHYLVPEWSAGLSFEADTRKVLGEYVEAKALGIETRPVLIGPVTLLLLGKSVDGGDPLVLLPRLLGAYKAVLTELAAAGAKEVQMDEPCLVMDLSTEYREAYTAAYARLAEVAGLQVTVATYFGGLGDNTELACGLPVAGLHLDLVRAPGQLGAVLEAIGPEKTLSLGVVDGRNIWIADMDAARGMVEKAAQVVGAARVTVAPSCSLLHVPVDATGETKLPGELNSWLSFAVQKLDEVRAIAVGNEAVFAENRVRHASRAAAESSVNAEVRAGLKALVEKDFGRDSVYAVRAKAQAEKLGLPVLPTTTIGSFPQTADVRKQRAAWRAGHIGEAEYERYLEMKTAECVRQQEQLGLDVLVHGEFERNDMVEYFGEMLEGFAFTQNGWVQSYGSRCVKPPVIYGDVWRPEPMTVRWSQYAQSLTDRPMKGMLTGPVTILQWSFVRNDIPEKDVAWQIGLALRGELVDLEGVGIGVIQLDEPALREGLPLRKAERAEYLDWAVKAFRLAAGGVSDATQVHTHMCYAEFGEIMPAIAALDADVISIESARSKMEILKEFRAHGYPNEVGPGVYDIHATRVPSQDEMAELLREALNALKTQQLWVNPDCGLKTRGWPETIEALRNMVAAAVEVRATLKA